MCIIVAKAKGIKMPDGKTLLRCFEHNPDGAGIMWAENDIVNIRKGFMSYKEFDGFLSNLSNRLNLTDTALVMHFRITTHGNTTPQNCHPFPISKKIKDLKQTAITTDIGVAHNGIIPVKCIPKLSDTQTYIVKRLSAVKRVRSDFYSNPHIMKTIEDEIHSKMCFLTDKEEIYTIGQFVEENGVLYSNNSYEEYTSFSWYKYLGLSDKEIMVCPIEGIVVGDGDMYESDGCDFFMDKESKVYQYDYVTDALTLFDDAQAFTHQGTPYRFCSKDAIPMILTKGGELW